MKGQNGPFTPETPATAVFWRFFNARACRVRTKDIPLSGRGSTGMSDYWRCVSPEISDFGCFMVKIQRAKGPLLSVKTTPSPLPFIATKSRYFRPLKVPKRTTYGRAVPGARTPRRVSEPQSSSKNSIFSTELAGIRGLECRAPIFSQKESSRTSSSPTFTTLAISCHA